MADNEKDGGQDSGTASPPSGAGSAGTGDSGSSFDAQKLQATIESLTRKLDEVDSRSKALQGDKDRGVNKTNEENKELKRKLAEIEKLKKSGLDEDGAIEEHGFREDIRAVKDQLARLNPTPAVASGAVDAAKVIEKLQLDANDPKVAQVLREHSDPVELAMRLGELKGSMATSQSDSALAPAQRGGPPAPAPGIEQLTEQYKKDMLAARGRSALLSSIKAKAREDGVLVDSVTF